MLSDTNNHAVLSPITFLKGDLLQECCVRQIYFQQVYLIYIYMAMNISIFGDTTCLQECISLYSIIFISIVALYCSNVESYMT